MAKINKKKKVLKKQLKKNKNLLNKIVMEKIKLTYQKIKLNLCIE